MWCFRIAREELSECRPGGFQQASGSPSSSPLGPFWLLAGVSQLCRYVAIWCIQSDALEPLRSSGRSCHLDCRQSGENAQYDISSVSPVCWDRRLCVGGVLELTVIVKVFAGHAPK